MPAGYRTSRRWPIPTAAFGSTIPPRAAGSSSAASVATPVVAGITNLRGGVFSLSSNAELTHIYSSQSHYTDITTGNCRTHRATTNWDFCTGAGVPKGH